MRRLFLIALFLLLTTGPAVAGETHTVYLPLVGYYCPPPFIWTPEGCVDIGKPPVP